MYSCWNYLILIIFTANCIRSQNKKTYFLISKCLKKWRETLSNWVIGINLEDTCFIIDQTDSVKNYIYSMLHKLKCTRGRGILTFFTSSLSTSRKSKVHPFLFFWKKRFFRVSVYFLNLKVNNSAINLTLQQYIV